MPHVVSWVLRASLPEAGDKKESAIHWDMLADMRDGGRILANGELVYEERPVCYLSKRYLELDGSLACSLFS